MAHHFRSSERQGETDEGVFGTDTAQEQAFASLDADVTEPAPVADTAQQPLDASSAMAPMPAQEAYPAVAADADPYADPFDIIAPADVTVSARANIPDPLAEPTDPGEPEAVHAQTASADVATPDGGGNIYDELSSAPAVEVQRTGTPTISMRNVTMVYPAQPNKPALQDVSLDIYPGEFVFIVGHSGSGKSTFIRLLTRELRATKGKVLVAGQDLTRMRNRKVPYLRRQLGCVFQDFKLLPDKTCYENVAFALECIGKPRSVIKVQVPEVLRLVGLEEKMDSFPDQLSGGEQQRVAVARAMVNRPPLLVCDEPTGNLDPAISLGIMKLLDRINRTGTTVVMATHDREMVDSMRKRVIALEAGHVVRDQERGGYGYYGAL